ncbi:hypothetical protein BKA82DRAFT_785790 [Pisolithus tinctorius]|uniref:Uncharacterized protein n=1 Tax=Pisolithus tinctorius Marx 270 TaxID=870435 RepID=A0A0C3PR37_PISTI|nr:hypothetical protein BKA82DRAFT_785790 [Pisolithus tinctorius]KIO11491.1 hypothetical protein M404DRAFT_785790 [Pisolithus tinctorius Marx 270]
MASSNCVTISVAFVCTYQPPFIAWVSSMPYGHLGGRSAALLHYAPSPSSTSLMIACTSFTDHIHNSPCNNVYHSCPNIQPLPQTVDSKSLGKTKTTFTCKTL